MKSRLKSRPGRGRAGFVAAASMVAFIGFGAASIFVNASTGETAERRVPAPTQAPTEVPVQTPLASAQCQPSDRTQEIPAITPAGVVWDLFGAVVLPYSPAAGPLIVEKETGVARCFAHTPLGALIATDQIGTRYILASNWRRVADLQVVPGDGRAAFLGWRSKRRLNAYEGGWAQVVAFRFITYTGAVAVIEKVMRSSDGSLAAYAMTVEWDGDWKLSLQPDGIANPAGRPVEDLGQFVRWSGV